MKRNYLLIIALIAVTVFGAGCSKEESSAIEGSCELKVTTNIVKPSTKSMVSSFTSSTIGIFVDDAEVTGTTYNYLTENSTASITTGANSVTVTPSIPITADATVYAWYPTTTTETVPELTSPTSTSTTAIEVLSADDFAATAQTDYLWATPATVKAENRTAELIFKHALSKVNFSIKKADDYTDPGVLSAISLSSTGTPFLSGTGKMLIADGTISDLTATSTLTYTDDTNPITLTTDAQETVVLVAPATLAASTSATSTITITLTIDDDIEYHATLPVSEVSAWAGGKAYTYNITVNKKELEISRNVQITDWESNATTADLTLKIPPETANCYMIVPGNSLEIPVNVRGNGVEVAGTGISASISPMSVGILWETSPELIFLSTMSSDEEVTIIANSTTSGNAVIAAYSGENQTGEILWSWHIWVTDYDPDVDTPLNGATYPLSNDAGGSYVFMDRNLGATTVTPKTVSTLGLLYQWGRKDPFPGSSSTRDNTESTIYNASGIGSTDMITKTAVSVTSNLPNAILHPLTFYYGISANAYDWYSVTASTYNNALWGGADISAPTGKTMFDPSPAGWRVPPFKGSASPWTKFRTSTFSWNTTYLGLTYTDGSFYPAAGSQNDSSGSLYYVGSVGHYWSGSPSDRFGYSLKFYGSKLGPASNYHRANGFSVRCVQDK